MTSRRACRRRRAAYVRFATRDAALLELMFAGKHREPTGALDEAAERAFAVMLELIEQGQAEGALERGDPERVGLVLFATIQGIAALRQRRHGRRRAARRARRRCDRALPARLAHERLNFICYGRRMRRPARPHMCGRGQGRMRPCLRIRSLASSQSCAELEQNRWRRRVRRAPRPTQSALMEWYQAHKIEPALAVSGAGAAAVRGFAVGLALSQLNRRLRRRLAPTTVVLARRG